MEGLFRRGYCGLRAAVIVAEVFTSQFGLIGRNQANTREAPQLQPYQNVFYLRYLFDVLAGEDHSVGYGVAKVPGRE